MRRGVAETLSLVSLWLSECFQVGDYARRPLPNSTRCPPPPSGGQWPAGCLVAEGEPMLGGVGRPPCGRRCSRSARRPRPGGSQANSGRPHRPPPLATQGGASRLTEGQLTAVGGSLGCFLRLPRPRRPGLRRPAVRTPCTPDRTGRRRCDRRDRHWQREWSRGNIYRNGRRNGRCAPG